MQVSRHGAYIENHFDKVKLEDTPPNQFGVRYINISDLEEGNYILKFKHEEIQININVIQGVHWNVSDEFII